MKDFQVQKEKRETSYQLNPKKRHLPLFFATFVFGTIFSGCSNFLDPPFIGGTTMTSVRPIESKAEAVMLIESQFASYGISFENDVSLTIWPDTSTNILMNFKADGYNSDLKLAYEWYNPISWDYDYYANSSEVDVISDEEQYYPQDGKFGDFSILVLYSSEYTGLEWEVRSYLDAYYPFGAEMSITTNVVTNITVTTNIETNFTQTNE